MAKDPLAFAQVVMRVPLALSRALKMHCISINTTAMDFVKQAIVEKLARDAAAHREARLGCRDAAPHEVPTTISNSGSLTNGWAGQQNRRPSSISRRVTTNFSGSPPLRTNAATLGVMAAGRSRPESTMMGTPLKAGSAENGLATGSTGARKIDDS